MTDNPRFQAPIGLADQIYRQHHGAPLVEFVFRLADWWLGRKQVTKSDAWQILQSASTKPVWAELKSFPALQPGSKIDPARDGREERSAIPQ